MVELLARIGLRLLLCGLATWAVWQWLGVASLVLMAPLLGIALARPLIDLAAVAHGTTHYLALRDRQGRHFAHRGHGMDISQDEDDQRWLLVSDVRKVLTGLPRDEVLQRQFPGQIGALEAVPGLRIRADALLDYLRKATDPPSLKFKIWLEREVVLPAEKARR